MRKTWTVFSFATALMISLLLTGCGREENASAAAVAAASATPPAPLLASSSAFRLELDTLAAARASSPKFILIPGNP